MESDDSPTQEPLPKLTNSTAHSNEGDLSALVILPTPDVVQPEIIQSPKTEAHNYNESQEYKAGNTQDDILVQDNLKDDDFGDFGHFASTAVEMFPVTDEGDTRYAQFNADVANKDVINGINAIWPVFKELKSRSNDHSGLIKDKNKIVPSVTDREWVNLFKALVGDTVFSENGGSRLAWRRSMIRQRFLESLNISEDQNPPVSAGIGPDATVETSSKKELDLKEFPKAAINNQNTAINDREKDLMEAKKLCDFAEEEIRKKTVQELQLLMQNMQLYQQKMYEQSNYWLDAKEQLIMDAETHNKVIASLVQYARDQQQAPKIVKSATNSSKRKT